MSGAIPLPTLQDYGDRGILIHYETLGYNDAVMTVIQSLADRFLAQTFWHDIIPAYHSLLITFDSQTLSLTKARRIITAELSKHTHINKPGKRVDIPIVYGGIYGPDMATISNNNGLSEDEIITLHSGQDYRLCMLGFIPGFAFLSEAPKALHHPRHRTPRRQVPAGSVGIAGWQTGIYGLPSPGGWQIIGRTPLVMFDSQRDPLSLISPGDTVRFIPSSAEVFV